MDHPHPVAGRKPPWLKVRLPSGEGYAATRGVARERNLHTVCEDALCPNIAECWGRRTATFMILGDACTRSCGFCAIRSGRPAEPDPGEPRRTAMAVRDLGLRHAIVTSVTRDDLEDGGASLFAGTIREIRSLSPGTRVEVLTPDFRGSRAALDTVWDARPDVHAHNIECVPRLQGALRSAASYERSLMILEETGKRGVLSKTGIQVGHGETWGELLSVMDDLSRLRLDILTVGQYLRPRERNAEVRRYYAPEEFAELRREGLARGIRWVQAGPLVRSSYRAEEPFENAAHSLDSPAHA